MLSLLQVQNRPAIVLPLGRGHLVPNNDLAYSQLACLSSDEKSQAPSPDGHTTWYRAPSKQVACVLLSTQVLLSSSQSWPQNVIFAHALYLWLLGGKLVNEGQRLCREACIPERAVLSAALLGMGRGDLQVSFT